MKLRLGRYVSEIVLTATLLVCLSSCQPGYRIDKDIEASLPEKVDFNFHIKPILSDRCFKCHGPDEDQRKADLRLDQEESALAKSQTNTSKASRIIRPGSLHKSEFFQRIISDDPDYMMPEPASNLELSEEEIALLAKWIEQGAEYKPHWAFVKPEKPVIPEVEHTDWAEQDMDRLILARMEKVGLQPAPKAEKTTLLRRLSLDLTGLPPTIEEVEEFLADESDDAYEKAVDRLLASPHYGEHMAVEWLDVARYADSHGYQDDGMRNTWPWRDWVVKAFNENMPYDEFVRWQLAGDLLPNPTKDQLLATCFNRNHPQTQEGGVVDEEYRVEYVADRTNTFGKAFLGLTMECARCHDHKYDPISQEEYYSLSAFFNNNHDTGIVPYNGEASPTVILTSPEAEQQIRQITEKKNPLEAGLLPGHYVRNLNDWLQKYNKKNSSLSGLNYGLRAHFKFDKEFRINDKTLPLQKDAPIYREVNPPQTFAYFNQAKGKLDAKLLGDNDSRPVLVDGKFGKALRFKGDCGVRFNEDLEFDRHQPFSVSIWVKLLKAGEYGPIFCKTNGDFEGYRGWICNLNTDETLSFQFNHVWPANAIEIKTKEKLKLGEWTHIAMAYDGSSKAAGLHVYLNGKRPDLEILTDNLHKSLLHGVDGTNQYKLPFLLGKENQETVVDIEMDELRVYDRQLSAIEVAALSQVDQQIVWEEFSQEALLEYYLLSGKNNEFIQKLRSLTALRKEEKYTYDKSVRGHGDAGPKASPPHLCARQRRL